MSNLQPYIGRVVVVLTAAAALIAGLLPALANLDLSSTAGIISAVVVIGGVVVKWLDGLQQHEARASDPYYRPHA